MFAIEIDFNDGVSPCETVLLRRASAILGGTERSHLIMEGAGSNVPEIKLVRLSGRNFNINSHSNVRKFNSYANIKFGNYNLGITSLDYDLALENKDYSEIGAISSLKKAFSNEVTHFPAISILNQVPSVISFYNNIEIIVGRLSKCLIRIEMSDVSSEHCKFGNDSQGIWLEDLGSTNGTFVNSKKISGRKYLKREDIVTIGSSTTLLPLFSEDDLSLLSNSKILHKKNNTKFPCLISNSTNVKPGSFELIEGKLVTIGRDPASDIWVNAPHISREHLNITLNKSNEVIVVDKSSNGTYIGGNKLKHGNSNKFSGESNISLDLCSGVELELLFNEEEKKANISNVKLNKEDISEKQASLELEVQESKPKNFNLDDIFEDADEFNLLAERFEQERLKETKSMEFRVLLLTLLLVITIVTICLLVFTSDYFLF